MKKNYILFLFVAVLGLAVSSCSNDDSNDASIVATWELTHEGEIDIVTGKESLSPVSTEGKCTANSITFLKEGIFTDVYSEYIDSQCETSTDAGTWSKDGNKLTIKYSLDDTSDAGEILELSSSTLKIKYTHTFEGKVVEIYVAVYKRK